MRYQTDFGKKSPQFEYDFSKYEYTLDEKQKRIVFEIKPGDVDYSVLKFGNDIFRNYYLSKSQLYHKIEVCDWGQVYYIVHDSSCISDWEKV